MTFAKGITSGYIPLGGVAVGDRVADVLIERGGIFEHGFTSSGHPVACAVAIENIRLIERERLVQRVARESGPYLRERFLELRERSLVGAAETCGLMAALVLVKQKDTMQAFVPEDKVGTVCRERCFDEGVIVRTVGNHMIIAPPLVISTSQIDEMIESIKKGLDRTYQDLKTRGLI